MQILLLSQPKLKQQKNICSNPELLPCTTTTNGQNKATFHYRFDKNNFSTSNQKVVATNVSIC